MASCWSLARHDGGRRSKGSDVDAVRNDVRRVESKVLLHRPVRGRGDGDARVKDLHPRFDVRLREPGQDRPVVGGVEGRDGRSAPRPHRNKREGHRSRLVKVNDVELSPTEPLAHAPGREQPELDAGRGSVVRNRKGPPGRVDEAGDRHSRRGRCENPDIVPEVDERIGEARHMELDTAGTVQGVGADDADLHSTHPKR